MEICFVSFQNEKQWVKIKWEHKNEKISSKCHLKKYYYEYYYYM